MIGYDVPLDPDTRAGSIRLRGGNESYNFLESSLGAKVAYPVQYRGVNYITEAHAKWFHELTNPVVSNTAAFSVVGSPSFTNSRIRTADDTFNVGAGLTILSCGSASRAWAADCVCDDYWRADKYAAQQVTLRFTAHF